MLYGTEHRGRNVEAVFIGDDVISNQQNDVAKSMQCFVIRTSEVELELEQLPTTIRTAFANTDTDTGADAFFVIG